MSALADNDRLTDGDPVAEQPPRDDLVRAVASLRKQSARASEDSTRLAVRAGEAHRRLREAAPAARVPAGRSAPVHDAIDATPSAQMRRRHVVILNSDPAFLDAARVLLQAGHYNVTTTNLVPRSYELIEAAGADVLVIDLTIEEPAVWSLVERLQAGERTRQLPVVFTATDPVLLERAEQQRWPVGGRFLFLRPFRPEDLADVVHALAGPA